MAIKTPSINIRRLYTEEELELANISRECNKNISDIMNLQKLKELKAQGKVQKNDISHLTWNELQEHYMSEYKNKDGEIVKFRDKKKVARVESFIKKREVNVEKKELNTYSRNDETLKSIRKLKNESKNKLNFLLSKHFEKRELTNIFESDYITLSESTLTSALKIKKNTYSELILIITADQTDMMGDIIFNRFIYCGKEYELFGASAGQLRKKKLMFIESEILGEAMEQLTNSLSIEKINSKDGVNINKWSAYVALSTSATTLWDDVDIDRVCVVEDFETVLENRVVDHIDGNYEMNRISKDVAIPHTDGFGMMCPKFCRDTRIIRAPWIKGLLAPMDFKRFVKTKNGKQVIKDVWDTEHNVKDLDIILTKSQFKMWKFYDSWEDYKEKFKANKCEIRYMIAESKKDLKLNALFNYQMWQTLDIDNKEEFVEKILKKDKQLLIDAHREVGAIFEMFRVKKKYSENNLMGKALYLYPQMIRSSGFKKNLKDNISARRAELAQGRIKINGVYTFLIPDVYAWCEYLFLDIENPKGLLKDGEVSCKLVDRDKKILVNRSPHLYPNEHCIRKNIKKDIHISWFIGRGVYTSVHDMISKQLFFDVDGDIALVIDNDELVEMAEKTVKDLVPLDFKLGKAEPEIINSKNKISSYLSAFEANIGQDSNRITKVMNGDDKDLELVAKICWMNNMAIDKAKTNFMIEPKGEVGEKIKSIDSQKLPYFFHWAKNKPLTAVEAPNENSLVDKMAVNMFGNLKRVKTKDEELEARLDLEDRERKRRFRFNFHRIGKFNIDILLLDSKIEINEELIKEFTKLADSKYRTRIKMKKEDENFTSLSIDAFIKKEMYDYCKVNSIEIDDAVDICVKYVFGDTGRNDRKVLFNIFGDRIVDRLEQCFPELVDESKARCYSCGKIIRDRGGSAKYCIDCRKDVKKKQDEESKAKKRNKTA